MIALIQRVSEASITADGEFRGSIGQGLMVLVCGEKNDKLEYACLLYTSGVTLLIDSMSYQYLVGAEIDYKEDLEGAQFVIKNPNATTTCSCGSSFSV